MVRRHPHVFGDVKADTSEQVLKNWARLKAEEKKAITPPSEFVFRHLWFPRYLMAFRAVSRRFLKRTN